MKKLLSLLLALAACVSLCAAASAAEAEPAAETDSTAAVETKPTPVPPYSRIWGKVSPWDGDGIFLKNDNKDDHLNEVVVHVGEVPVVDASTGLPMDLKDVKEGDVLYAWIGSAATLSLPPQVAAKMVVGNVPADAAVPEYGVVSGAAVKPAGGEGNTKIPLQNGDTLEVTDKTAYTPWLTRQMVRMEDLVPGTEVLVWKDTNGAAEKVVVFPCAYEGYLTAMVASHGYIMASVNGNETEQISCKRDENGNHLAPIRAVAEAAGCEVRWDKELGAVVSRNGETLFSVLPGAEEAKTADDTQILCQPCLKENGTTYLDLRDLAVLLNLFFAG